MQGNLLKAWYFIRTLVFILGLWASSLLFGIIAPVCYFLPYKIRFHVLIGSWARFLLFLLRFVCGVRYQILGKENIPLFPCVVLSKHTSTWETICLPLLLKTPAIVVKKQLLRIPGFGWGLALCEPIVIDRAQPKKAMQKIIRQGKKYLKWGRQILLFPEGTRNGGEYKTGGAVLAKEANVPVLPVAHTAASCWPNSRFSIKPGIIYMKIGHLIDLKNKTAEEITREAKEWIEKTVIELNKL